jgi:cytochrome oxidase assembly protein ShyY1
VYRFLLTPRWWGITLFAVLAIPVCVFMGSWQLGRFEARVHTQQQRQHTAAEASTATAKPLASLLPVSQDSSGRSARATGHYDTGHPFLVPDRTLDGRDGFYALALLRTDSGRALPVVRGWLPGHPDPSRVPPLPTGRVTVTGALQPSESQSTPGVHGGALPQGQLGIISAASLVNLVPYDVYDAWVTVQHPAKPLKAVPPVAPTNSGLDMKAFQNLGYTAEWFVFAGFVLFMWFRLFRRDAETARDAALGLLPDPDDEPQPEPEPELEARSSELKLRQ